MQISLKWTYNGYPPSGRPPPCNARTRKQYVQGGASLPEPPLFTCSDPPKITNIARTCAAQQARRVCSLRQPRKHRHCIAQSHAADPRDTARASDTVTTTHAMLRAAKRQTTRPPHQGGLCAPWTQLEFLWHASQRADRTGQQRPIRRSASLVLRLVHPDPRDSRRSRCWSCSAGSLEARPEQAMRAISGRGGQWVFQRERLTLPLMGGSAGGEGGSPVERSCHCEPESPSEGGEEPSLIGY